MKPNLIKIKNNKKHSETLLNVWSKTDLESIAKKLCEGQ